MKGKKICLILSVLLIFSTLTACGNNTSYATISGIETRSSIGDSYYSNSYDVSNYKESSKQSSIDPMIMKTASVYIDVDSLKDFDTSIKARVSDYQGYFESSEIQDNSYEKTISKRGNYAIRIPQKNLESFLSSVESLGTTTSINISAEDVTLEYIDVTARIETLKIERARLEELLDMAVNVSEIIEIQDRISDVQYTLDSQIGQKNYLESKVEFSTVYVRANENHESTGFFKKIFDVDVKKQLIEGLSSAVMVFVSLLARIPLIIIVLSFGIGVIWLVVKICKKIFKK